MTRRRDRVQEFTGEPDPRGMGLGIATSDISPNDWGTFQFAHGDFGSETAYGPDKDGFWKAAGGTTGTINSGDELWWVKARNGKFYVTPLGCPEG